jgi:hypothetical protein
LKGSTFEPSAEKSTPIQPPVQVKVFVPEVVEPKKEPVPVVEPVSTSAQQNQIEIPKTSLKLSKKSKKESTD